MNIAIIPARSGSKRLPGKNYKEFDGLPLFYHSVLAAQKSNKIDKYIVSTDCPMVINFCKELNLNYHERPKSLSQDSSSTYDVLKYLVEFLDLDKNDLIITLQPTSPLRPVNLIDDILETFEKNIDSYSSYITVTKLLKKASKLSISNYLQPINYSFGQRSQELVYSNLVYENGLVYVTKMSTLLEEKSMFGVKPGAYLIPEKYTTDIDTLNDWNFALKRFKKYKNENR